MYQQDSLFTLSILERLGVLAISLVLTVIAIVVVWRSVRGKKLWIRLVVGFGTFVVFVWLSPQIYYTFYLVIFDTLPWQFVVGLPPLPDHVFKLLTFTERANLSSHGQGALGWGLILLAGLCPNLSTRWGAKRA